MAIINYFPVWSSHADSERSLSVNARVVRKERSRLGEQIIVGLRLLKDAIKFHDPVNCRLEKILVTKEMRKSVRLAHSAYKARLDDEKEEKRKELEETKRKKEGEERLKKEEKLLKSRHSLAKNGADILKDEKKARENLEAVDELLSDATSKLHDALSGGVIVLQL